MIISTIDQVGLLRSLFAGREDAYGVETPNGPVSVREPLTDKEILSHLEGKKRIGVYCLTNGNLVHFAVNDLDEPNKEKAVRIYVALLENNLFPYVEKSKSKGFHVWLFFDEPIPARAVRRALLRILKKAGLDCELFPKQDSLASNNGLGNFIYLPLFGGSVKTGGTLFLNSQFEPYPDQWTHLSKVRRTKAENILTMAEEIPEEPKAEQPRTERTAEGVLDVSKYLLHYNIPFKVKEEPTRTLFLLGRCLFADNHTTPSSPGDSSIVQDGSGKLTYQCFHAHCKQRTWADARKVISGEDSVIKFFKGYAEPKTRARGEGRTLSQILNEPETAENYLTKPILSRGDKGFVVSSYKMGKTLLLTQWTLALSTGMPFLGMEIPEPAKVLYIRFELKEHRFQKRLRLMIDGMGGREKVRVEPVFELVRGFNVTDGRDFDWLLGLIRKHRPDCLMLDPLYKMASLDLKDTANAMPLIRRFDTLMELNPGLAVVIAHHLRKQTGEEKESWDSTYGPMFFFADMDFEIRIKAKHRKEPVFTFDHISNDIQVEPFSFKRNQENLLYYLVNPETDHVDEILDHIQTYKTNKTSLKDWMMEGFGFSHREASGVIERMLTEGKIVYEGGKTRGYLTPANAG